MIKSLASCCTKIGEENSQNAEKLPFLGINGYFYIKTVIFKYFVTTNGYKRYYLDTYYKDSYISNDISFPSC